MKRTALIISLLGALILLILMQSSKPIIISDPSQLKSLEENQKVIVSSIVVEQRNYYDTTKLLILDNQIQILCDSCPNYIHKNITILGVVDKYNNKEKIMALKITQNDN